jgi:RNA polymerase sigma factor (TIGR02999 family)
MDKELPDDASLDADVTAWLSQLAPDAAGVGDQLFTTLYQELRGIARNHLRRESEGHTLSPTALSHEAWFRLASQSRTQWRSRAHFLAVASMMMRRILVNHELARRADKRSAELESLTISGLDQLALPPDRDVISVHEALLALQAVDPRAARGVELRFFGGLENEEIAEVLGVSLATVKRDWVLARAWLHRELLGTDAVADAQESR